MIPGKIVRFLEERANVAIAGTRNRDLVPRGHRVTGWLVSEGGRIVRLFVPEASVPNLIEALEDNGRLAVTFEEVGTHETYQLKGRYVSHRPVQPAETDIASRTRERFVRNLRSLFPNERMPDMLGRSIAPPAVVVEMEVREVFLQTPGPGAGTRLAPPPDVGPSI